MRKVVIGCKGDPALKWEITQEAEEAGMSSSEYMETILENRHIKDDVASLRFQLREAKNDKDLALRKLEAYEVRLASFFQKYAGQSLPFRKADGTQVDRIINTPIDLLDCILSSLKNQK